MTPWKYTSSDDRVVIRQLADGSFESCLASLLEPGTAVAPADPADFDGIVNALREAKLLGGVTALGHTWDSDDRSRANLTGTVAAFSAGVPMPAGFCWRSKDNQNVPMTMIDLVTLSAAMLGFVNAVYQRSWELKAELAGASDPSAVDLESGWPS